MRKMLSARVDLPDVNVWLALIDQQHAHHLRARRYWDEESADKVAFCRISMLALLRLGTNTLVMHGQPFTPPEIWRVYRDLRALPEVVFCDERAELELRMAVWSDTDHFPIRAWTDCYLAALAVESGCRLVSFDNDFTKFSGLDFLRLRP